MKRSKKENRLKKKFDDVIDLPFLTDREKRKERRMWKKKMSKTSRQNDKEAIRESSD